MFLALWPGEALRHSLSDMLASLRIRGGRPEPLANLHITLVFIGDVAAGYVGAIEQAAAGVSGMAFELTLGRIGYWERSRILWLGPRETPPALYFLVKDLRVVLEAGGLAVETRPYLPHMTLARGATRPSFPAEVSEPVRWRVDSFSLMESVPAGRRRAYRELVRWPLQVNDNLYEPAPLTG